MRHRVKGKKLNRHIHHRRALTKNQLSALISHGRITTTETKAKALQSDIDRLVTKAKKGTVHHRRQIDKLLNRRPLTNKLVDDLAKKMGRRTSGFTRIIKLGTRQGDNASMARIEFVDNLAPTPTKAKPKSTPPAKTPVSTSKASSKTKTGPKKPSPAKTKVTK